MVPVPLRVGGQSGTTKRTQRGFSTRRPATLEVPSFFLWRYYLCNLSKIVESKIAIEVGLGQFCRSNPGECPCDVALLLPRTTSFVKSGARFLGLCNAEYGYSCHLIRRSLGERDTSVAESCFREGSKPLKRCQGGCCFRGLRG